MTKRKCKQQHSIVVLLQNILDTKTKGFKFETHCS